MTKIVDRKTKIRAATECFIRGRRLVVELRPDTMVIRESGRRTGYEVDWRSIFIMGAAKEADRKRMEKKLVKMQNRGK